MEDKITAVRKYWTQSNTMRSDTTLNIFDANGNTLLHLGEASIPEKDASILSRLLASPRNKLFTAVLLKSNYLCLINAAGQLIARDGFNDVEERHHGVSELIDGAGQRLEDNTCGDGINKLTNQICVKRKQKGVDVLASGAVSGLVVVINGKSCDQKSISGLLDDTIGLLEGTNSDSICYDPFVEQ